MIADSIVSAAKQVSVADLVATRTELRRVAGDEFAGACPKCGGSDRLHATETWWFCRQCHTQRSDAIGLVRWLDGVSFAEAVQRLTSGASVVHSPQRPAAQRPAQRPAQRVQRDDWRQRAERSLWTAQRALSDAAQQPWSTDAHANRLAVQYLLHKRGLSLATAQRYGLGCAMAWRPGGARRDLALAMPWYDAGQQLTAIRYRFVPTDDDAGLDKLTSEHGSVYAGLYGQHVLTRWPTDGRRTERLRTLVVVEGEINAMSIAQVAGGVGERHDWRVDVVSVGSETATLSDVNLEFAQRYGRRLAWLDKRSAAARLAQQLGADALASPNDRDANDLLQSGFLGGFLAATLVSTATSTAQVEGVLWDLWDSAAHGVDVMTASIIDQTARRIGRSAPLAERSDGLWWQS